MKFYMDLMNALALCQYRPEHSLSKNIKLHEMKKNTYTQVCMYIFILQKILKYKFERKPHIISEEWCSADQ